MTAYFRPYLASQMTRVYPEGMTLEYHFCWVTLESWTENRE